MKMRRRQISEDRESSASSSSNSATRRIILDPWSKPRSVSVEPTVGGSDASSHKTDFLTLSILDTSSSQDDHTERDEDEPPCKLFRWGDDGYEFVGSEGFSVIEYRPTLSYSWTPSTIRLSSLDGEGSPKFLFRDMPAESSLAKTMEPSSSLSSTLVGSPKTPNQNPTANDYKTPVRSLMNYVDSLSPVFDKLKLGRKKIKPTSPLSPFITKSSLNTSGNLDDLSLDVIPSYQPVVLLVHESAIRDYPGLLADFASSFKAEIVKGPFERKVTHVLLDEDDYMKLEHLQAIGFKKYLVNLSWIENCISEECLLDPASFEYTLFSDSKVPPTCLARSSTRELFRGYVFFCAEPFYSKINYNQLVELLLFNGGQVVTDPRDFATCNRKVRVCIVGEIYYYVMEKNKKELRDRLEGYKCVKVHHQWILQVFASFRLLPLIVYLYDSTPDDARIAGVPRNLLE